MAKMTIRKDGKAHIGLIAFMMLIGVAMAATTTIWDIGTGVSGTIGTCKVTSDGTSATLAVDKISISAGGTIVQPATGRNTLAGTNNITGVLQVNGIAGYSGIVTNCATLTNKLVYANGIVTNVIVTGTAP